LKVIPFPHILPDSGDKEVIKKVYEAFTLSTALSRDAELYTMQSLTDGQKKLLAEMHLISPDMAGLNKGAVLVSGDQTISIMINEEDHLRIQTVFPGLQIVEAYNMASKVDDVLEEKLDYAFDEQLGYLTACPTNVGTGIRASVMMHLPVLTMTDQIGQIFSTISQLGLVVRGFHGEGTQVKGNLYQISNQITLGKSEEDIIQNVTSVVRQLITSERKMRKGLSQEAFTRLEDKVFRSYGVITNAKLLSSQEAIQCISDVRLGLELGIIKDLKLEDINGLFISTGPAYIHEFSGEALSPLDRDLRRAQFIRTILKK
jgi:protein arginine kinase